jgi:hypothetical protein
MSPSLQGNYQMSRVGRQDAYLNGDLASAKVLFGLAERKKPIPEPVKKRHGLSPADRLAAQPQWQGKEEDEETENGE